MSAPLTVADYQNLATAVVELLPCPVPLTATLEPGVPAGFQQMGQTHQVATLRKVGASDQRVLVAVTHQTMQTLAQSGLDLEGTDGLSVILDTVAQDLGHGVVVAQGLGIAEFLHPATVYFSLRTETEIRGWFALNVQEVTPVFDKNQDADNTADPVVAAPAETNGAPGFAYDPAVANVFAPKAQAPAKTGNTMRMLYDVEMTLTAEIGRAKLPVRQILDLTPGAIIELDRVAGSPADLMVNGHLVARGEVVVIDEDYGLRITEIMDTTEGLV